MLSLFEKWYKLYAPVSGTLVPLEEVPDQVFATKIAGDGIAIEAVGELIVAPASGKLSSVFSTNHAFGMTLDNGMEILVHVGLDTVTLNGTGFERIATEGTKLRAGDPVLKIDRKTILSKGISLITPVVITNVNQVAELRLETISSVQAGNSVLMRYRLN